MKTPRLALLAFLAFSAPYANAGSLPTWTVVEEGPRSWARVFFTVGTQSKTLRCRYHECKPEAKGIANLYTITPVGTATPTKVTIYKLVPRSKWNPRYHTDGPYEKVPEIINAKAQPYASELSHFKLDNTGAKLVVVQGTVKYPATTDISQAQYNSYDQLKVAPPTKMIDDVVRPSAPDPIGPPAPPNTGNPATAKWWCDPATGEKYSAVRGRRGSTLLANRNAECKKAAATTPPPPVVVTPPADTVATLALLPGDETRWLTKRQASAYSAARTAAKDGAARKAADDQYRALIEAQTRPEAQAAYKAARALPVDKSSAALKAAVGGVEMWGGKDAKDIKAIVEPFQAAASTATAKLLEIQLSKADWDLLKKSTSNLTAYTNSRMGIDGDNGDRTFNKDYVDPVALRLSVAAARTAAGAPPAEVSPNPDGATLVPLLTEAEKKLLTPSELAVYQSIFDTAKGDPKDPNLQREAARLRALIASENRGKDPAYAAPSSLEAFNKLPEWQKRKFCADLVKSSADLGADARAPELGGTGGALNQLSQTDGRSAAPATSTRSDAPADWTTEACKPYRTAPVTANPTTKPPVTADVPVPPGVDAETKEKEKSKWLTQDLVLSAVKGGMIGLLVGSLFGPVGLIAGPIIGAAISYGLTKITSK